MKSERYFNTLYIYEYISSDLCEAQNRTGEFQRLICSCAVDIAMTSNRLSFASVEMDKNYSLTLPRWKSLCQSWSHEQPQQQSLSQLQREAEEREPKNEVDQQCRYYDYQFCKTRRKFCNQNRVVTSNCRFSCDVIIFQNKKLPILLKFQFQQM